MYTKLFFRMSIFLVLISGGCRLVVEIGSKRTDNVTVKEKQVVTTTVPTENPDPSRIETPVQIVQKGRAEAISVYASEYGPENAFDLDDRLSRWISNNPTPGVFCDSWLSYTFDRPKLFNTYYIKPEKGGHGREPVDFIFQAWDDKNNQWIELDAQNGINWGNKVEAAFFFRNNKKYQKYRLYVTKVTASDVVSIFSLRMGYMEPFGQN